MVIHKPIFAALTQQEIAELLDIYYLDRYAQERFLDNLRADIPQKQPPHLPGDTDD